MFVVAKPPTGNGNQIPVTAKSNLFRSLRAGYVHYMFHVHRRVVAFASHPDASERHSQTRAQAIRAYQVQRSATEGLSAQSKRSNEVAQSNARREPDPVGAKAVSRSSTRISNASE
jgi:hypothetical protein